MNKVNEAGHSPEVRYLAVIFPNRSTSLVYQQTHSVSNERRLFISRNLREPCRRKHWLFLARCMTVSFFQQLQGNHSSSYGIKH